MSIKNRDLKRRIIDISYKKKLAHIGSCLTAVDFIDEIYAQKKPNEKFVLSSGHAGLALYVVLEKYNHPDYGKSAVEIYNHHGTHPDRCISCGLDCSTGSLGQGLPIAVGMALADRSKNVYCLISDGEMAEGSIWESLSIINDLLLLNLKIYINLNGWAAYREVNKAQLIQRMQWFNYGKIQENIHIRLTMPEKEYPAWLREQIAHYKVLNEKEYKDILEVL